MDNYQILVDSSVWIEYFKKGNIPTLDRLIEEDLVSTNQIILTELIPFLHHHNHDNTVEELCSLDSVPLSIDWDFIRDYQQANLKHGINSVGIPDLLVVQQVIQHKLCLFSFDKHFKLMQKHLKFELM
jgi:hypothetical protein